ncbi:MAG: hypothetical protein AAF602_24125 [Myxococcota bacterium]
MSNTSSTLARLLVRRDVQIWLIVLTAIGLVGSFVLLPDHWSVARKLAAGVLFGVGSVYCAALPRMLGGHGYI